LGMLCENFLATAEERGLVEDQIAMESASSFSDTSQYRSYLPPPSGFKFKPSRKVNDFKFKSSSDDAIEDLPTPMKLKSSSELQAFRP
jgi:hypothetical protein